MARTPPADDELLATLTEEQWHLAWVGRQAVVSGWASNGRVIAKFAKMSIEDMSRVRAELRRIARRRSFTAVIRRLFGRDWNPYARSFNRADPEWLALLEEYRNSCAYCGRDDLRLERDHVIPLGRRGRFGYENVVPSCRDCNSKKMSKSVEEFLAGPSRERRAIALLRAGVSLDDVYGQLPPIAAGKSDTTPPENLA